MSCATPPEPPARPIDDRLLVGCGLAWSAAVLYGVAALHHLGDHLAVAIVGLALCVAVVAWSVALYRGPSRRVRIGGFVLGAGILALWIVADPARAATGALGPWSQTLFLCRLLPGGLPVSAGQWTPAAIGTLISIANVDTLVLIGLVALAGARLGGRVRRWCGLAFAVAGAALILLSCVSLTVAAGGHVH